jgi:hypothetical protein
MDFKVYIKIDDATHEQIKKLKNFSGKITVDFTGAPAPAVEASPSVTPQLIRLENSGIKQSDVYYDEKNKQFFTMKRNVIRYEEWRCGLRCKFSFKRFKNDKFESNFDKHNTCRPKNIKELCKIINAFIKLEVSRDDTGKAREIATRVRLDLIEFFGFSDNPEISLDKFVKVAERAIRARRKRRSQ